LLRAIAAAGIPIAVYGILQYFGWDPWIDAGAYHIGPAPFTIVRPPGTMGHASYFATYLLAVIFVGAALIMKEEFLSWRVVGAVAGVLGTAAVILTGTRAAMLGLAAGSIFLAWWVRPRIRARELALGAVAAAALAGFYFSPAGQLLRSRTRWVLEDPTGGGRLLLWRDSLRMAATRWPIGLGPETFSLRFPQYQSAELARAHPDSYQESPHNIFIHALASEGLAGLAILMSVTALGFYSVWMSRDRKLAAALGAALAAMLISQQFTSFTLPTAVFFYLTLALVVAQAFEPVCLSISQNRIGRNACTVVALPFVVFAAALFVADAGLARVDQLIRAGKPRDGEALYQRLEPWQPPGMRTDLEYSRAIGGAAWSAQDRADAIALWQQGLAAAVRATRNAEDRQNAWLNLAVFYGRQNDAPHTEQSLRAAIDFAPNWFKPHWLLSQVLRTGGRIAEARAEAARAADLDGGKHPEVTTTLAEISAQVTLSQK